MSKTTKPGMLSPAELLAFDGQVRVAQNLHHLPKVVWSVYSRRPKKLIAYVPEVVLRDVTFVIQPGEQNRARLMHQRNLHAWAEGFIVAKAPDVELRPGRYNVHKWDTFVDTDTEKPILRAKWVVLGPSGLLYSPNG